MPHTLSAKSARSCLQVARVMLDQQIIYFEEMLAHEGGREPRCDDATS